MSGQLLDWEGNGENMISEGSPVYEFSSSDNVGDTDMVNSPPHYNQAGLEVIQVINAYHKNNYNLGNAVKYLLRCEYKGHKEEDLRKCVWYILEELGDHEPDTIREVPREQGDQP